MSDQTPTLGDAIRGLGTHASVPDEYANELAERADALEAQVERVRSLAESWRYKGEFGWGAWQEGEGPDEEGHVLDNAAAELRATLAGDENEPARLRGDS